MTSPSRALGAALAMVGIAAAGALSGGAHGSAVVEFMTAKSLPDATVAVIDPESGTSSGTAGSDVLLAPGDIILFRFAFSPAPENAVRGVNSYLTEYIPPGTELVGVRITDADGNTLEPRAPGLAIRGCAGGSTCNNFASVPCAGGTCSFPSGSVSQVYGDTGVFYTTSTQLLPAPLDRFLTLDNGIAMQPSGFEPRGIVPEVVQLLNDTTGPYYAHNDWDWDQVRAYGGQSSVVSDGDGNTPFRYGSPVAGPQSYYDFQASDTGSAIQLNNVVGPWQRVQYPGSHIGTGPSNLGSTSILERASVPTALGYDLTPAAAVPATAVRVALGEARVGEPAFVEVALRVISVPIDPTFGTSGGNVDCGEVFGSDISAKAANSGGANNPWRTYVASAACVFLRLKFDLEVDQGLASTGEVLTYTLDGKNLSLEPEHAVVARLKYVESDQSFVAATPPPNRQVTCPAPETNKTCLEWDLGTLAPSDEFTIEAQIAVQGQGGGTNVVTAQYRSTELTAIDPQGFSTTALTVVQPVAAPKVTLANQADPTTSFAAANSSTWVLAGTIANAGTTTWTQSDLVIALPTGWGITGNQITIGTTSYPCSSGCATNVRTFSPGLNFAADQSRAWSFRVTVPAGTAAGLYPIDVATTGTQSVFGSFESHFPHLVDVPVGQRRTQKPVLACPIVSTAPSISGTSEPNAAVKVLFNLIQRGTGTASGAGAWTVTNYLPGFGEMYGGLEVRATARVAGELESEPSDSCIVATAKACSDGFDNDGDGAIDFPADPGCASPNDNNETNPPPPQCSDGADNNGTGGIDWPSDPTCSGPEDPTEGGSRACSDGIDNDGDGDTDFPADTDCTSAGDGTEVTYRQCQDGRDNDGDGRIDFTGHGSALADAGCHSAFDDTEADTGSSPLDTKARVLVVVDSSGSMNWNTCADDFTGGDGSTECPGVDIACATCGADTCSNTQPDDARLFQVKAGLSNVVAAFGDVEYSLMRFHQRPVAFACPSAQASLQGGGWQGGGAAPCGGGFAAGDLLVSFAQENEGTILDFMNHDSDYDGTPPPRTDQEIRGSGTTPLAGALTSANGYLDQVRADDFKAACRPYRVVLVTDGAETCGGNPAAAAAALYADGAPVYVIGFATPDPAVIANLDSIAAAGGTTQAILANDESALSAAMAEIISGSILVERCNGADDDCDALVDEDFPDKGNACDNGEQGDCREPGAIVCDADGDGTHCNAPAGDPEPEVCNSHDDDCDGLTDEGLMGCSCNPVSEICNGQDDDCDFDIDEGTLPGVGDDCGQTVGACEPGSLVCQDGELVCQGGQGPIDETCNSDDDDCDGLTDEIANVCYDPPRGCTQGPTGAWTCVGRCHTGVQTCAAGGACVGDLGPGTERCNGIDDDCDGQVDENFGVGGTCDNGAQGICHATGQIVCRPDGTAGCNAPDLPPGTEVCNTLDDDCDGQLNEDLGSPIGDSCGGGAGCAAGVFVCDASGQIVCEGAGGSGTPEVCNAADDDCDTIVDEDVEGFGGDCVPPGFEQYQDIGQCEFGHLECVGGVPDCRDYVGPSPEISCNGIDEDCDGLDDQTCPLGLACVDDACREPCPLDDEIPCSFGEYCLDTGMGGYCLPDPCADITCAPGFACDRDTEQCVDLCASVTCTAPGTTCVNGLCQDCFALGCPDGQVCTRDTTTSTGQCVIDQCFGVECADDQFCRNGACVALTCDPACPDTQRCEEGVCVDDRCAGIDCPEGQVCNSSTGTCQVDICLDVRCPAGEACNPADGNCVPDPCPQIDCPAGTECVILPDSSGTCRAIPTSDSEYVYAGGSGCSAAGDGGSWLLIGLGLLLMRRRSTTRQAP